MALYVLGQVNSSSPPLADFGTSLVQSGGSSKRAAGIASVLMLMVSVLNEASCTYCAYGSADFAPFSAAPPEAVSSGVAWVSSAIFFFKAPLLRCCTLDPFAL